MKKIGFIVLAVVLALGAMGAGYAAWAQNLTVSASVASGIFDTQLVNVAAVADTHGVATLSVSGAGPAHSVTVTAANLYPGASEQVTFKINNPGTIPAKVNTVSYSGVPAWVTVTDDVNTAVANIAAGATSATCTITITMPDTTTNQGVAPVSFTFTVPTAQQY
jgi:hypothetical protein